MRVKGLLAAGILVLLVIAAGALSLLRRDSGRKLSGPSHAGAASPPLSEVSLPGKIQAEHVVPVGASVAGTIDAFLVDVGQEVFEGQMLARISNQGLESARQEAAHAARNAQEHVNSVEGRLIAARLEASRARADAARSRARFEQAERTYQRQQMLNREGATPRLVYEKAGREFEAAQAEANSFEELARQADDRVTTLSHELDAARHALDDRNAELETATGESTAAEIHSPVSGIVVARTGDPGKIVGPEEAKDLIEIAVNLAQLEVLVQPAPDALSRVHAREPALIFIADLPGAIPGTVTEVTGGNVIVEFSNPSAAIRPGMTAQVRLKLE